MRNKAFSICFKNVASDRSYECTPNEAYVFEIRITLSVVRIKYIKI
jgi:hypothetical protein